MAVIHILKDGSRPKDLTGHIVRLTDADPLYQLIHNINKKGSNEVSKYETIKRCI